MVNKSYSLTDRKERNLLVTREITKECLEAVAVDAFPVKKISSFV
jgi:hypothetical protein